jgi:YegS/Rv2252/BmrU family lipid kinase
MVNPAAAWGRALRSLASVEAELRRLGAAYAVVRTESLEHARSEARAAAESGEAVIALGGDGLVGAVAGGLRGTESPLAVVPSGRGNDFARKLGIPRDAVRAARLAVEGTERVVDMGTVDGTPFVGIASVGVDSDTQAHVDGALGHGGRLVYLLAALRALMSWEHARFTVRVDGVSHSFSGYSVSVANSGVYGGGMRLVPHADLEDGQLDVITIAAFPKALFVPLFLTVFRGGHVRAPAVRFLAGGRVEVEADRPFAVYADGERVGALPATVEVSPRCLRVIAPPR